MHYPTNSAYLGGTFGVMPNPAEVYVFREDPREQAAE
jgi:hypothetical protein